MKILIISQHFWPESFIINDVASRLAKNGNSIHVLTGQPNYNTGKIPKKYKTFNIKKQIYNKVKIFRVPILSRGNKTALRLILNYITFIISGIFFLKKIVKKNNFDIIFVYATSPILKSLIGVYAKTITKSKLVIWIQDLWPGVLKDMGFIKSNILLRVIDQIVKYIYKKSDLLIAQSNEFKKYIVRKYKIKNVIVHENPGREVKIKFTNNRKKKIILYTGNIGHAQSPHTILNAANFITKNDNFIFKIVGSGSKFKWLKNEIKKNKNIKNKIILENFKKQKKLILDYYNSDILLIILSKGDSLSKTIPNKFQNYLSIGKPILCSGEGAVANKIKKNNLGFVSMVDDSYDLYKTAKKMTNMSNDNMRKIHKRNKAYFNQNYTLEKNISKLENILLKI